MPAAFVCCLTVAILFVSSHRSLRADETPSTTKLTSPLPYQVVQREGYNVKESHPHAVGGAQRGAADVRVAGSLPAPLEGRIECRTVLLDEAFGAAVDWTDIQARTDAENKFTGRLSVPAGGWYRLETRIVRADNSTDSLGDVEPFGVGEVFVVAGQSYAEGSNDELLKVNEPQGRVAAFNPFDGTWRIAHDPQPHVGDGGTIWPPTGDLLVPILQVPVGFVNVAVGGTASAQWLPGEKLYRRLLEAGRAVGEFRAVLWQQGESDVIARTTTETYVKNIKTIRESLAESWKFSPTWLLAKSTLHPTVYNRPEDEGRIRAGLEELWHEPGFAPGPDTDLLDGPHRGPVGTRQHFSGLGQRTAGVMWFAAIWNHLQDK
ncbi:MAG: sialate O-acetylesterase [Planctomycetaceae bacterium]